MDRIILHSDINSCYASIEHVHHPELRGKPLAVGGSSLERHGIILAKDEAAKKCGVKTGMVIWQAKRLCPELTILPPRMELYLKFSGYVQEIYSEYTNMQESFGIDESWLDFTGCIDAVEGCAVAGKISQRIKSELGITVSIGVSWNKVFAKLGSDYRKPDAITHISRSNFKTLVWPLPVESLLYVGRATSSKLRLCGITTIGDLALSDPDFLKAKLGKAGYTLHGFANGFDTSPVLCGDVHAPVKSIGNSTTTPRDLQNDDEVRATLLALADSVGTRLRKAGLKGRCISVSVRNTALNWRSHQSSLRFATNITKELLHTGMELFHQLHSWPAPVRSIGLCVSDLANDSIPMQTDMFGESDWREQQEKIDSSMDKLRRKYGFGCLRRGAAGIDVHAGSTDTVYSRAFSQARLGR